ncbi:MAG TPA: hypothetical protein VMY16_04985 [Ilumatobacteraceae bacterium]|nr:hypothetical protein [Ilumatobacteraceae bacterium]
MTARARRRGWMLAVGVLLIVGLLGAAVALWMAAGNREADNVAGFARAPVGCDTTLDFESTGTFVLYAETSGRFDELAGACEASLEYDRDPEDRPTADLALLDPEGDDVDVEPTPDVSYDVDGFVGSAIGEVQIDTAGDHVLTVAPTDGDAFAVAIGRHPDEGVSLLRWGAVAAAIFGLVVGGIFLVVGSRRSPTPPTPAVPWTPDGRGWPASPPGFPVPSPTTGATGPAGPPVATTPPPERPARPTSPPAVPEDGPSPWAPPPLPQ